MVVYSIGSGTFLNDHFWYNLKRPLTVKGKGEKVPFTDLYKWHVKDVIAVFEVKKTLFSKDIIDSFTHLRSVIENHSNYIQSGKAVEKFDISYFNKLYARITGIYPPPINKVDKLQFHHEMLYHTLLVEYITPVRITLGYHGFKTEYSLRESLYKQLEKISHKSGFGVGSFPQLIVSGEYSLIKMNGQPYSTPLINDFWNFYFSTKVNPIMLILELIWTRLERHFDILFPWGEDIEIEQFNLFLSGKIKKTQCLLGWEIKYTHIKKSHFESLPLKKSWQPSFLSDTQFFIINKLCKNIRISLKDSNLVEYLESNNEDMSAFVKSLLKTGLVAIDEDELVLITEQCDCVILPDGRLAAAENNTGRLTNWVLSRTQKG